MIYVAVVYSFVGDNDCARFLSNCNGSNMMT